jgi:hypothetical protein
MAVVKSFLYGYNLSINGPNSFSWNPCETYNYSLDIPHPEYFTYNWSCSSNLIISSSNLNTIAVIPTGNGASYVRVEVYSEGRFIGAYSKDFTISTNYYLMGTAPISVTSNTNWTSNNHVVLNDIIVEPGVTLTITGTVYCSDHGCFKVKPQGRLVLDGGKLTNACPDVLWPGIEVWGNSSANQYPVNGTYAQGYLELKNGAVIENAVCAVELWRPNHWSSMGGIVIANGGTGFSKSMAEALRESVTGEPRTEEFACPDLPVTRGTRGNTGVDESGNESFYVSLTPNPAKSLVYVNYILPEGMPEAVLEITSVLGGKVIAVTLEGQCGSKEIDLGRLSPGIYNYTAYCGNKVLSGKLMVAH